MCKTIYRYSLDLFHNSSQYALRAWLLDVTANVCSSSFGFAKRIENLLSIASWNYEIGLLLLQKLQSSGVICHAAQALYGYSTTNTT